MRSPTVSLALLAAIPPASTGAELSKVPTPSHSPSPFNILESDPRFAAGATILPQGPTKTRVRRSFAVDPSKATNNLAASATATQSVGVADGGESTADHFGQCEDLSDHSCPNN